MINLLFLFVIKTINAPVGEEARPKLEVGIFDIDWDNSDFNARCAEYLDCIDEAVKASRITQEERYRRQNDPDRLASLREKRVYDTRRIEVKKASRLAARQKKGYRQRRYEFYQEVRRIHEDVVRVGRAMINRARRDPEWFDSLECIYEGYRSVGVDSSIATPYASKDYSFDGRVLEFYRHTWGMRYFLFNVRINYADPIAKRIIVLYDNAIKRLGDLSLPSVFREKYKNRSKLKSCPYYALLKKFDSINLGFDGSPLACMIMKCVDTPDDYSRILLMFASWDAYRACYQAIVEDKEYRMLVQRRLCYYCRIWQTVAEGERYPIGDTDENGRMIAELTGYRYYLPLRTEDGKWASPNAPPILHARLIEQMGLNE